MRRTWLPQNSLQSTSDLFRKGELYRLAETNKLKIDFEGWFQCGLGRTDSTRVSKLLTTSVPRLEVGGAGYTFLPFTKRPVCLTLPVPLMLICEHKNLRAAYKIIKRKL